MLSSQIHFFRMYMNKFFLIMNGVFFDNENTVTPRRDEAESIKG